MRTAFIIIAIFTAVVLLVRFAAAPVKPRFCVCSQLPANTVIANIKLLGKQCSVTQYGMGVGYGSVKIRSIIEQCKKQAENNTAEDWQYVLCNAENIVLNAFADGKNSIRQTVYCGHVGKYPRVYLFSNMLVNGLGCDITQELLLDAVSVFEQNAPFTVAERKILCGVIKFCLIGYLYAATADAIKRDEIYRKGIADGKSGKVNLDFLHMEDYVCGLTYGTPAVERNSIIRLFEYNGVNINCSEDIRRKHLAQLYVTVNSVLRSLDAVNECKDKIYSESSDRKESTVKHHINSYAKFFNIAFPILLAVYAVFTCIFASQKYVALFSVAAIITYGAMRIPVLLQAPTATDIFLPIRKTISKFISRKRVDPNNRKREFMSETAYFGSEPQYAENTVKGELSVCCDNRGNVAVRSDGFTDWLYIDIDDGKVNINLAECDGAAQSHRYTYRVAKVELELCAEVIAPIDVSACVIKLMIVNRSNADKKIKITGFVVRDSSLQNCMTENINNGILAVCKSSVALSLGGGAEYGGDLSSYCADKTLRRGYGSNALVGVNTLDISPFARVTEYMAVIYAHGRNEAESLIKYVFDSRYYVQATEGAYIYGKNRNISTLPQEQYENSDYIITDNKTPYAAPKLPEVKIEYELPFGGITDDGERVITNNSLYAVQNNILSNGNMSVRLDQFGMQNISYFNKNVTAKSHVFSHVPQAYAVIGENGLLWSPTVKPIGKGEMYTVHGQGYTAYKCAYNGTVCTQKCYTAVGNASAIVEITLCNKTNIERQFDIMFSAVCDESVKVSIDENTVIAETGGRKLRIFAVGENAEYAMYKEAYYIYGGIKKASAFRSGGSTPAPTASVRKTVKANGKTRVVFCIADQSSQLWDLNSVDMCIDTVNNFYAKLGRIALCSDDSILNISYMQSLYCAYNIGFCTLKNLSLRDQSFILGAAKYADVHTVKNRIYKVLSTQRQDGLMGESYADCLQFVRCVIEYAEFTGDDSFWQEVLPFAEYKFNGKRVQCKDTAIKHILKAVEYLVTSFALPDGLIERVWQCQSLVYVLRFADDKIKSGGFYTLYKKRFLQAAEFYADNVKRLTANNFFDFKTVTQAYMCAKLLFDLDLNEKAYNIIKFNNPIERQIHYGARSTQTKDFFTDAVSAAVYFTTVTEKLLGVKFKGKTVKISPHTAASTPSLAFDIRGKTKDIHITVDGAELRGNWKMRAGKISYFADGVDIGEFADDIVFYRDGNE